MSKEEALLEFVLENFSNIKEVLNATKDIENFLIKFKLNEERGIGVILNKTKSLVDRLYEHSVKVKDEFYEHYNKLENIPNEKNINLENEGHIIEEKVSNVSDSLSLQNSEADENSNASILEEKDDSDVSESHRIKKTKSKKNGEGQIVENEENELEGMIVENERNNIECRNLEEDIEHKSDDVILEENNSLEDPLRVESSDVIDNTLGNTETADNDDTILGNYNLEANKSKEAAQQESNSLLEDPLRVESSEITNNTLDNNFETAEKEATLEENNSLLEDPLRVKSSEITNNIETAEKEATLEENNSLLEDPLRVESSEITNNTLDNNIETAEKEATLEENNSLLEDPLREETSEIIDDTIDSSTETAKKDVNKPEKCSLESNNSKEVLTEVVTSDIIDNILDTNKENVEKDEESLVDKEGNDSEYVLNIKKEPKAIIRLVDLSKLIDPKPKKSVKFDNSVIILTSSDEDSTTPKKKSDVRDQSGKLKSALKNSPSNNNGNGEAKAKNKNKYKEKNETKSRENEVVETLTKKSKKSENSSDSDIQEVHSEDEAKDETNKRKHNLKKDKRSLNHAKKSDKELRIELKRRDNSSDSDESNTENKKNNEDLPIHGSRRSSRIDNKLNRAEKRKENLRKIFKRKATRSGRSKFEIVNGKSRDDSSDSDSKSNRTRKEKSFARKKDLVMHISDTSSFSEHEDIDVELKNKSMKSSKKRKYKIDVSVDVGGDEKFTYKVHIPLPRIECNQLKDIYLRNKEILQIKRLRNVNLSSSKRSRAAKNDSKSSSDTEKPKSKKAKKSLSNDKSSSENDQSSKDEPLMDDIDNDQNKNIVETNKLGDKDQNMENLKKCDEATEKSEDNDSSSELEKITETKSKNEKNKKEEETNSKDIDNKQEDKNSDEKENKSGKEHSETSEEKDDTEKDKGEDIEDDDDNETCEIKEKSESDSNSDSQKKKSKKKWRKDKLLTSKLDSSDSEEEFSKFCKKKDKSREELMSDAEVKSPILRIRKAKKLGKKAVVLSDSENSDKDSKKNDESSSEELETSHEKSSSEDENSGKEKKIRRRIKRTKDSSSSDEDKSTRKNIRRLIAKDALSETTKQAEAEEKERKARIAEKQKKYNNFFGSKSDSKVEKLVLDYDEENKKELLSVHKGLVKKLKPHQASGIQFMWDASFESLERTKADKGSGCILAHCMGLGKTLQVIALSHTLLTNYKKTGIRKIMVVCPLNTVLNWKAEFKKWLPKDDLEIYELVSCKQNHERQYVVHEWHTDGGVLIMGYHMFRNFSNPDNKRMSKKLRAVFQEAILDPGPDLVICDEGHLLKNEKTNLSIAMNRIKTARRIVLTGTPLQNNLKEYWCMVQFIKPNLLGTYREYLNRFVNPIINGQYTDSTQHDILLMRKRSHVLHKLLDGVVQRRDYAVLEPYLPPKYEYVLFVALTETQVKLYKHYMEKFARQNDGSNRTSFLFTDFQSLQRICTHPRVLLDKTNEKKEKESEDSEGSLVDFINDGGESLGSSSDSSSSTKEDSDSDHSGKDKKEKKSGSQQRVRCTRALAAQRRENNEESESEVEEVVKKEWWQEYCDGEELDNINNSGKLFLLFKILKECEEIGDKVLVFSQSLYTLNCIEYFLDKIDEATQKGESDKVGGHTGSWAIGLDYFRLDGSSSCDNRAVWCDLFNNPNNIRARLFLISTKAGGLGINLVAANRVIIFDVSWNPSHDIQSIYRVYRFGQTKPCYIYRFVAYGTMEMKIYERQVTKQAISKRVIDEQQIDRHYNQNDLQELYKCDLEPTDRPIPLVPKDVLLGEFLQKYEKTIYKYHLHQSLLENKEAEGLNEEERKAAWEEFENEKVLRKNTNTGVGNVNNSFMNAQAIEAALASIVRKDNPTWSEVQIKGIIPALVQQLQVQLAEGDATMYARVQQELQIMQAKHAQKLKEAYYQQQVMRLIQQQEQQAKILGNMSVNPALAARTQASMLGNLLGQRQGGPSSASSRPPINDVIELND